MHICRSILLITFFSLSGFCNAPKKGIESYPYKIGSTKIIAERISFKGNDSIQLVQLHNNESTARTVGLEALEKTGGALLSISNRGQRLIQFKHRNKGFVFDPNRIFSANGRRETL